MLNSNAVKREILIPGCCLCRPAHHHLCLLSVISWMDKLGVAAKLGVGVVMRQTFYADNYALVAPDLSPNPVSGATYGRAIVRNFRAHLFNNC